MTIWDDRILEYVKEYGGATVGELTDSDVIHVSNAHVSRRCRKLSEKGFLRPIGNGAYVITEIGGAYLDGEYDAEQEAYINDTGNDGPTASGSAENGI
jgi:predicted transcriptional regulator of viral defense system